MVAQGDERVVVGPQLLAFLGRVNEVLPVLNLAAQTAGADIEALIAERQAARQAKDWKRSDELRDLLAAQGIELKDTP